MDGELLVEATSIIGGLFPDSDTASAFKEQFGGELLQSER